MNNLHIVVARINRLLSCPVHFVFHIICLLQFVQQPYQVMYHCSRFVVENIPFRKLKKPNQGHTSSNGWRFAGFRDYALNL